MIIETIGADKNIKRNSYVERGGPRIEPWEAHIFSEYYLDEDPAKENEKWSDR